MTAPGRSPTALTLLALAVGLVAGTAIAASDSAALRGIAALLEPVGALWVNAIRMIVVPLVVALVVTSVTSFADLGALGRLGARTLALFLALLAGAAVFTALVAPPLFSGIEIDPATVADLRDRALGEPPTAELPTLRGFLVGLVPTNPIRAAAEGAMLPLLVFTVLFALALTRLPRESADAVTRLFRAAGDALLVIVHWILWAAPLGVFALSVGIGASLGLAALGAVGYYVLVVSALLFAAVLGLYPLAALAGRTSIARFARAAAPAQAMAVATRSSLASLPALIEGARRELGDRPGITGFVLPVAVATFKINTPISDLIGPLFLAQLYGIELSAAQVVTMTAVAVAMSFSNPGVPSGGLFVVAAPILLSAGLPLEGIGLLIAVDAIPDIFATVVNVTGDMAVATILAPAAPRSD